MKKILPALLLILFTASLCFATGNKESDDPTEILQQMDQIENGNRIVYTTVVIPSGKGPFPAVAINHGHGGSREENGGFADIASALAKKGIASIRMDFAGCGESEVSFAENTISSMISDSNAALAYLTKNYPIDTSKIGILGYSMGGRIALEQIDDAITAIALLAGSVDPGIESAPRIVGGQESFDNYYVEASTEIGYAAVPWYGNDLHISKAWFDEMNASTPLDNLNTYRGDLLVMYGDKDVVVSAAGIKLAIAAYPAAKEIVIAEADHGYGFYSDQPEVTATVEDGISTFFAVSFGLTGEN